MYTIEDKLIVPISIDKVWAFFSNPENLKLLTPQRVKLSFKDKNVGKIYPGKLIHYNIAPLFGIKFKWTTKIDAVKELCYFTDVQLTGPFKTWIHEHHFNSVKDGTEIRDLLKYEVPFGKLGEVFHPYLVKPKLEEIFEFRKKKIREFFFTNE